MSVAAGAKHLTLSGILSGHISLSHSKKYDLPAKCLMTELSLWTDVDFVRRSQVIDTTLALKRSAGVSYPSVIRGLSLSCLATALSFA
jgi:hypothetical protein